MSGPYGPECDDLLRRERRESARLEARAFISGLLIGAFDVGLLFAARGIDGPLSWVLWLAVCCCWWSTAVLAVLAWNMEP